MTNNNRNMTGSLFHETDERNNPPLTCRTCTHRQRWQCGGRIIQYCGVLRSNRTFNGLKKIKTTNHACTAYKAQH